MHFTTRPFLSIVLLLCLSPLAAQKRWQTVVKDTTAFNNRYYKQELGLSVQGVFAGNLGGSLIWKVRDDRAKLIPVSFANFWRYQAYTSSSTFTGYRDSLTTANGYLVDNINPSNSSFSLAALIGRERVNFFNRFNLFYGWDAGPRYNFNRNNTFQYIYTYDPATGAVSGSQLYRTLIQTHNFGVSGVGFLGVKYHFSPRISLSWEAAFSLYYTLSRRRLSLNYTDGTSVAAAPVFYHEFGHNFTALRFITLNYHFKRY